MYKRYENYKDSGVEWIGEIPVHWELRKHKNFYSFNMGETILKEDLVDDGTVPVYSATEKGGIFGFINKPKVKLRKGDLVIPARGVSIGYVNMISDDIATTTQTTIYGKKTSSYILSDFVYFFMIGNKSKLFFYDRTAIPQVTVDQVKNNHLLFPTLNEQMVISKYLYGKTSEIDSLIADKEELIKRLEEYKQSVITEAVSKGLNPDVKMKDSGIEWIGEIPEHWEIKRLKDFSSIARGTVDKAIKENEITVYLVQYTNVYYKSVQRENDSDYLPITVTENELQNSKVNKGDILLTASSETPDDIGRSTVIFEDLSNHVFGSDILRIRIPEKIMAFNYKKYLFENQIYLHKMNSLCRGVTRFRFGMNDFKTIRYLIPPIDEQKHIADHLDGLMIDIDLSIDHINKQLNLVKSYRQSLIYEAVTGKIDVRDYQSERSEQFA